MQIQEISHSEQQVILPQDFQQANNLIDSIQPRDSNPTKNKVKIFKNRVFQLLKIFVQKSANVNTLIQSMKQQMFIRQPQKMKQLVTTILNKQNIKYENLQQLINFYQIVLLYKSHKKSSGQLNNISVDFVAILKKISLTNNQQAIQIIKNMFKSFAFQRKCTIKIHFFTYLFRKTNIQGLKKSIIQDCQLYLNDQKLRNAQKKQIIRVLENLDRNHQLVKKNKNINNNVKKQQNISQQQIQIVKRQDIEGQNQVKQQNKDKKQQTKQQLQKLQRIKANKKKRNKNQTQQKNNQNDKQKTNNHSKNHQSKPQQRSQSKPQQRFQSKSQQRPQTSKPQQKPQQKPQSSKPEFKGQRKPEQRGQQKQIRNNQNRSSSKPHFKPHGNNNQQRPKNNNPRQQNNNSKPHRNNQKPQKDNSRPREDKINHSKPKFNKFNKNNKRN